MFQDACNTASSFIRPVVTMWAYEDNKVRASLGTGMLLNDQGWFLTAGHTLGTLVQNLIQMAHIQVPGIQITNKQIAGKKIVATTLRFGDFGGVANFNLDALLDLGVGQISGFTAKKNQQYATLRKRPVMQGELLCRIGYPFQDNPKINYDSGNFEFEDDFNIIPFVNEALVSRIIPVERRKLIETSSPGLMGQSGGPLMDKGRYVCGVQVHTKHYPLNFPRTTGQESYLDVGRAVDVDTVMNYLDTLNVDYLSE